MADYSVAPPPQDQSVLVVGADGMLGSRLATAFERQGRSVWRSTQHPGRVAEQTVYLDMSSDLGECPLPVTTTAILCAAVTSMERCSQAPEETRRINVDNTVALAKRLVGDGTFVIFLSSNAVFDGETAFAGVGDATNPRTEYGRQKAKAEEQLLELGERVAVVRFSKIVTPDMPLLVKWARDLKAGNVIYPFSDSVMAPLSASFAVDLLCSIARRGIPGITQASASRDISYADAARYLASMLAAEASLIEPISWRQAGIQFSPKHTTLDASRLAGLQEPGLDAPRPERALDQICQRHAQ